MGKLFLTAIVWLSFTCTAMAADQVPPIRLPASVAPVVPSATTSLAEDAVFVVECDTPCLVLASRVGFVTITEEAGPLRIRGRFADGNRVESRTYRAKQIWIIEAATSGEVEIIIVPVGAKDDATIIRRTLLVGRGIKPDPPKPNDPPNPGPPGPEPQPIPLGLGDVIKQSVAKNVPVEERPTALKIAEAYREGAKRLASGDWTTDKAIGNQRDLNTRIPGYKPEVWRPVFKDVADKLATARSEGKFESLKQYVAVWSELSLAFFEAAK